MTTTDFSKQLAFLTDQQLEQALENSFMLPPTDQEPARRAVFHERSRRQLAAHFGHRGPSECDLPRAVKSDFEAGRDSESAVAIHSHA